MDIYLSSSNHSEAKSSKHSLEMRLNCLLRLQMQLSKSFGWHSTGSSKWLVICELNRMDTGLTTHANLTPFA